MRDVEYFSEHNISLKGKVNRKAEEKMMRFINGSFCMQYIDLKIKK